MSPLNQSMYPNFQRHEQVLCWCLEAFLGWLSSKFILHWQPHQMQLPAMLTELCRATLCHMTHGCPSSLLRKRNTWWPIFVLNYWGSSKSVNISSLTISHILFGLEHKSFKKICVTNTAFLMEEANIRCYYVGLVRRYKRFFLRG